jgi:predicted  nucleic acid-binding Zn-ribbon protein
VHTLEAEVIRLRADGAAQADLLQVTRGLLSAAREDRNSLWTLATSLRQSCAALQQELERIRTADHDDVRQHAQNLERGLQELRQHVANVEADREALRMAWAHTETQLRQHAANLEHELKALREHVRNVEADRDAMRADAQREA